ncbi:PREDICTED: UPF0561 protein C2orf68 homolog [Priapulus caudatus]|uniref:UPF0561 protein C2orf68 homolog n=1 Tax=Priapulus caudatus TaxID=37621 RepID=A0ABM1DT61_PRICU|nr:PREDICTED: UPF0561 protein C2orf68 homolog [Priapulus caudatus]
MADSEVSAAAKINMKHGFMKSIIKNQIDRDNYDREMKQKGQKQVDKVSPSNLNKSVKSEKTRKPAMPVYSPPCRANKDEKAILFKLEYEDENGDVHETVVHEDDDARIVARKFGVGCKIPENLLHALYVRVADEIDKRRQTK